MTNNSDENNAQQPKTIFGLFGAGGHGREVMPYVAESVRAKPEIDEASCRIVFVEAEPNKTELNGYGLISEAEFFGFDCSVRYFNVAIRNSKVRQRIAEDCAAKGAKPMLLRSSQSIIYALSEIGEGAMLSAYTLINPNAKIGKFFHANYYSSVSHDCVIGDYVTFAPGVRCNGNVHIHDHAYVGSGAVLKDGTPSKPLVIGEGAVIGMGAVVTKDVAPFTTVVGNPARPVQK